jgi:hypothetical protein
MEMRRASETHEADKYRMCISQLDYWKTECLCYNDALKELMRQELVLHTVRMASLRRIIGALSQCLTENF